MIYGYVRVSTKGQARDGNSLEAQKRALIERGCQQRNIFVDSFTGAKKRRPGLDKMITCAKAGDTVMVTKLDRMARSAQQGMELIDGLISAGVEVDILNMGRMNNTPTGRLVRTIMLAFAEFERACILERTSEGKEIAKENPNYREGRPPALYDTNHLSSLKAKVSAGDISKVEAAKQLGVSRGTFYRLIA